MLNSRETVGVASTWGYVIWAPGDSIRFVWDLFQPHPHRTLWGCPSLAEGRERLGTSRTEMVTPSELLRR